MPKGYIIGHITVNGPETCQEHTAHDTPILQVLGGTCDMRGGQAQVMEGAARMRDVVNEFPICKAAMVACNDPDHQQLAEISRRTADSVIRAAEGV